MPREANHYLRTLERALAYAPAETKAAVLDDVRAHIVDALESGRSIEETLEGLGAAEAFAEQYRDELHIAASDDAAAVTGARMLHVAAVLVGVLAGAFVAFLLPSYAGTSVSEQGGDVGVEIAETTVRTLAQEYGPGAAALAMLPAVLALLPLVLPRGLRVPVALANAVLVTGFSIVSGFTVGVFYAPLALIMWVAVIVPWRMTRGLDLATAPIWRVLGAVLIALPALLRAASGLSGATHFGPLAWATFIGTLLLAALFAAGVRVAALVTAVIGLAIMVLTMFTQGMLLVATWWAGGLYLALGLSAYLAWGSGVSRLSPSAWRTAAS
jgi:MFS family permease